ncbi:hypothetical protein GCM10009544_00240 [Streptomyces stramineus]|uniref:Uncharacterized protein n=1 Tax=Streptomyces stramineus TaxID=173861 RepID=A0ABN0ZAL0_9ACTN
MTLELFSRGGRPGPPRMPGFAFATERRRGGGERPAPQLLGKTGSREGTQCGAAEEGGAEFHRRQPEAGWSGRGTSGDAPGFRL